MYIKLDMELETRKESQDNALEAISFFKDQTLEVKTKFFLPNLGNPDPSADPNEVAGTIYVKYRFDPDKPSNFLLNDTLEYLGLEFIVAQIVDTETPQVVQRDAPTFDEIYEVSGPLKALYRVNDLHYIERKGPPEESKELTREPEAKPVKKIRYMTLADQKKEKESKDNELS